MCVCVCVCEMIIMMCRLPRFSDSLSPSVPIGDSSLLFLLTASDVHAQLMYVSFYWSSNNKVDMCGISLRNISYNCIPYFSIDPHVFPAWLMRWDVSGCLVSAVLWGSAPRNHSEQQVEYIVWMKEYIYIHIYTYIHHTTCESTCDNLSSSAANQGDNTVSVAQSGTGRKKTIYIYIYIKKG